MPPRVIYEDFPKRRPLYVASDSIGQIKEMREEAEEKKAKAKSEKTEAYIKEKGAEAKESIAKTGEKVKEKMRM